MKQPKKDQGKKPAEKPVSLHPLKFEEAVEGLLKVDPEKIEKKKPKKN